MNKYLHIHPNVELPDVSLLAPFAAVVIVEESINLELRNKICTWLVKSGCLYMMAWGKNSSSWDDAIDEENLKEFDYGEIPEDKFIMTTWHDNETLKEVFWYSKNSAFHPALELKNTLLIHISKINREQEYLNEYNNA